MNTLKFIFIFPLLVSGSSIDIEKLTCYAEQYTRYLDMRVQIAKETRPYVEKISPTTAQRLYGKGDDDSKGSGFPEIEIRKLLVKFLMMNHPDEFYLRGFLRQFLPLDSIYYESIFSELSDNPRFEPHINKYLMSVRAIHAEGEFQTINYLIKTFDKDAEIETSFQDKELALWTLAHTKTKDIHCD